MMKNSNTFISKQKQNIFEFLVNKKKAFIDLKKELTRLLEFSSTCFGVDAESLYSEYTNSEFKNWFNAKKSKLIKLGKNKGGCSNFDCTTLYLLIRSIKPEIIIETGVKYGASTSHILEALNKNGFGKLYSFDFPGEPNTPPRDFFIRSVVKNKWEFIAGDIKTELPKLLKRLNHIDLFFHDSCHRFQHMLWEYQTVSRHLEPKGILLSHDVLSIPFQENAFVYFCKKNHLNYSIFRNIGVASKR